MELSMDNCGFVDTDECLIPKLVPSRGVVDILPIVPDIISVTVQKECFMCKDIFHDRKCDIVSKCNSKEIKYGPGVQIFHKEIP